MAEQAGLERPYRMQSLLGRSHWSEDGLRDAVRAYVIETLGDADGVLIVDETGFVKKGASSVGVARQYSGTAGRIENSQIGVFLAYASRFGQTLIDRRLYLPDAWAKDTARRAKAQVPEEIGFATKPEIARDLIATALDAGVPCAFVLADAVYGSDSRLRRMLEDRSQPYVLASASAALSKPILQRWPMRWMQRPGPFMPREKGARGSGFTIGLASACLGRAIPVSNGGFSSAAAGAFPVNGPITSASPPLAPRWPNSQAPQACAGQSKNAFKGPKPISGSIIAKRGLGMAGTTI